MPRRKIARAGPYLEASPSTLTNELFPYLKPGVDRVALVGPTSPGRFRGNASGALQVLYQHEKALKEHRGVETRIVLGKDDMEDFCFLIRTKKELIGLGTSTFLYWAAILGEAKRVRLYSIISDDGNNSSRYHVGKNVSSRGTSNWTNPILQKRIQFETVSQKE